MPSPPPPLRPGLALADFVLDAKLAVGGMAEIWSARGPDGPVALKILRPEFVSDPTFVAMFHDEVGIATRLRHPNIVDVYAAHEAEAHVLQSMELLEGEDLRRVLSRAARSGRRPPISLCLFVAQQLARALGYAHQRKSEEGRPLDIVHRDVSPHNVMLQSDGRVKLLDFGVARAAERAVRTRTGVIKGKLSYMAPEQALAVGVTPQTDIFAAGVVLWEMLTVQRLFLGASDAELLERVVAADVPDVRPRAPGLPEDVARLLERMLAQRAPDRPASMLEVEQALTRALAVHFEAEAADEAALARWLDGFASEPEAPAYVDEAAAPKDGLDVTATLLRPEDRDDTWTGAGGPTDVSDSTPMPDDMADDTDSDLAVAAVGRAPTSEDPTPTPTSDPTPSEDPTPSFEPSPSADETVGLRAPPVPTPGPAPVADGPDVARTWVDTSLAEAFDGPPPELPPGLQDAPTPHDAAPTPSGDRTDPGTPATPGTPPRPDKVRRPTQTEIIRAVESQATVEVEADPEVAALAAQLLQVDAPAVSDPVVGGPGVAATQRLEVPRRSSAAAPRAPSRPEQPTQLGDLVALEVPISATDASDGYERLAVPVPEAAAAPSSPSSTPPAPGPPPTAPSRSAWGWLLPGITLSLAVLVLVLIFLLIRGQ